MHLDEAHGKRSSFYISELGKIYYVNQSEATFPSPFLGYLRSSPSLSIMFHVVLGLAMALLLPLFLV